MVPAKQYFLRERFGVTIKAPALLQFDISLGDYVHSDQVIGKLYYPSTQEREDLIVTGCGYIFSLWMESQVPEGEIIYSILETEKCHEQSAQLEKIEKLQKLDISKIVM